MDAQKWDGSKLLAAFNPQVIKSRHDIIEVPKDWDVTVKIFKDNSKQKLHDTGESYFTVDLDGKNKHYEEVWPDGKICPSRFVYQDIFDVCSMITQGNYYTELEVIPAHNNNLYIPPGSIPPVSAPVSSGTITIGHGSTVQQNGLLKGFQQGHLNLIPEISLEDLINNVKDDALYNDKCPKCGNPAYLGFTTLECSNAGCINHPSKRNQRLYGSY